MNNTKIYFMDIETTSLNPRKGEIRLITFCEGNGEIVTSSTVDENLRIILEDKNSIKIFHNAKFDVGYLVTKGYKVNNYECTLVMAKVLGEPKLSLKELSQKYLNISMDKTMQHSDNWKQVTITKEHIKYAKEDVRCTRELYYKLIAELKKKEFINVYRREINALPAIVMLNNNGIKMDFEGWNTKLDEDRKACKKLEYKIRKELNNHNLNLNSPKQLLSSIRNLGINITSTSDDELAKYAEQYSVIKKIRKYRKFQTKIKTYGEKLKKYIDDDGRIRADWNLIGAITGRMSCSKPPLQGMPSSSREFFIAENGYKLVGGDYSQVELRVLANISKDYNLNKYFKEDVDLHYGTASLIFKKDINEISKQERQVAKSLNFGIVYGITSYGIANNLTKSGIKVTQEEAEEYRLCFLKSYPKVKELQDKFLKAKAIRTMGGRRWETKDLTLTQRLNMPIQGSAAEGLKEALALLITRIRPLWKLVAVVHDEIVLEVPEKEVEEAKEVLCKSMVEGMKKIVPNVTIKVESFIGDNWCK